MSRERTSLFAAVSSVVLMFQLLMLLSASTDIAADAATVADDSQLAVLTYFCRILLTYYQHLTSATLSPYSLQVLIILLKAKRGNIF